MKRTTKLLSATAALALTVSLAACGDDSGSGSGGDKITFGYIGDYNGSSALAIAEQEGLWEDQGLEVETKVFNDGPTQIQAFGAGSLDYGYIGPGAVWLPASGKAKIFAINTLGGADRVIAQPGITSIEQLKGKKVGVPEGTSGDMILQLALDEAGMTMDDIEAVPMDPPTVVSAFGSGQIDAAGIFYPLIDSIKQQVPDLEELAQNSDFAESFSFPTAYVTGNDMDAATTAKVTKVLREAYDYRVENPEETVKATAEFLGQPEDKVEADASHSETLSSADLDAQTEDGTVNGWFDALQEFFVNAGKLDAPVDSSSFYLGDDFVAAGK
jgi:NitT/TauT family transport system substrate-binding protein